ncbi:MAG: branched-chain amino acid transaminase [Chloroflexi bacterium]|nr:branched-chain amino acid transaminase [Chloroflexota bacterium]
MSGDSICFFNGQYMPLSEARIGVMTHAFNYGTGCFEGIRAYWNDDAQQLHVLRLAEHMERLHRSCRILMIDLPYSVEELCDITIEMLRRNGWREDAYLRPLAYKASEAIGVKLHGLQDGFTLFGVPFGNYVDTDRPLRIATSSWRRIDDTVAPARAKVTGIYVNSALAKSEANLNGFDEALMLTHDGHVSEGSGENIFMVLNGQLVTPPVSDNILVGITRAAIIELAARELGLPTIERSIDRSELFVAEEVFMCGTGAQIAPIGELDRRQIGSGAIGPITQRIQDVYFGAVRGKLNAYHHWCTPVYAATPARVGD